MPVLDGCSFMLSGSLNQSSATEAAHSQAHWPGLKIASQFLSLIFCVYLQCK